MMHRTPFRPCLLALAALVLCCGAVSAATPTARYGMNIDGISYYMTQTPFMDCARISNDWVRVNGGEGIWHNTTYPLDVDADDYVTSLDDGWKVKARVGLGDWQDFPIAPAGTYRLRWQGSGNIKLTGGVSQLASGDHWITYQRDPSSTSDMWVEISSTDPADTGDYIRDIHVDMPGYETHGSLFHPTFLAELDHFDVLRFLDWSKCNNNTTLATWGDRNTPGDMFWGNERGVPYEIMVALCNELDKDLWITVPHLADDTYVTKLAQLMRYGSDGVEPYTGAVANPKWAPLEPELKVWVQYSNEVWSPGGPGPAQHNYVRDVLKPAYGVDSIAEAYGRRAVELWDIYTDVFGGTDRVVRVLGGRHGATSWAADGMKAASGKADVVCVAPYLGGEAASGSKLSQYIVDNDYAVPHSEIFDAISDNIENDVRGAIKGNVRIAEYHGARLVTYEGGPGIVGTGPLQDDNQLTAYLTALHRDAGWGPIYDQYLTMLNEERVQTYTAYEYVRSPGKYGYFGHKEYQEQPLGDASTPGSAHKFRALLDFIADPPAPPAGLPRETILIDNDASYCAVSGFNNNQTWGSGYYGENWGFSDAEAGGTATATWWPDLFGREGMWEIQVYIGCSTKNENQPFIVTEQGVDLAPILVDFTASVEDNWYSLGVFDLARFDRVRTHNDFTPVGGTRAVLDAVRFVPAGVTLDNTDASFQNKGLWRQTWTNGYIGEDWRGRNAAAGTTSWARWNLGGYAGGSYQIFFHAAGGHRCSNQPITVQHSGGSSTIVADLTVPTGTWVDLGEFTLDATSSVGVTADFNGTGSTHKWVVADAIKLEPTGAPSGDL